MELLRTRNEILIFTLPNIVVQNIQVMSLFSKIHDWFWYSTTFGKTNSWKFVRSLKSCRFPFLMNKW